MEKERWCEALQSEGVGLTLLRFSRGVRVKARVTLADPAVCPLRPVSAALL